MKEQIKINIGHYKVGNINFSNQIYIYQRDEVKNGNRKKILVKDINAINEIISKYPKKTITQDYLYVDDYTAVRKRKIEKSGNTKYVYTVKTMKVGISVNEFEKEITKEEYDALKINAEYITLSKDRYVIPYVDELKIEVDVFKGVYEGVVFAEIEFKSKEQAAQIELPKWFDKEMSQIITNSKMATQNMKSFIEFEK